MPDLPLPKVREHPGKLGAVVAPARPMDAGEQSYAELMVASNFSFLRGASHPDELVDAAAQAGCAAVALTDLHTLAGVVRGHVAAKARGMNFVVGSRVEVPWPGAACEHASAHKPPVTLLLYPTCRESYGNLCELLSVGKRRAPKGECHLTLHDVTERSAGLLCVVVPPTPGWEEEPDPLMGEQFAEILCGLRRVFDDDRLSLAVMRMYESDDHARLELASRLAQHADTPLVAVNDVHYHTPARRELQDVLTCVRHGTTLDRAGTKLLSHAERHIKGPAEMHRLFAAMPQALTRTVQIARRAMGFSLSQLRYEYPSMVCPAGRTPDEHLSDLVWRAVEEAGLRAPTNEPTRAGTTQDSTPQSSERDDGLRGEVFLGGATPRAQEMCARIEHELALIRELGYAPYFLTCHDIVRFARSRGILCQGRGAAANSAVCFFLGITSVDPTRIDTLFERFVSKERNEPPDIDIDFEHERREEVIQYIYATYGRTRAALVCEVISYRGRSAVRDVGKALGLSLDCVDAMAKRLDWWQSGPISKAQVREVGLDPDDPVIARVLRLTGEILGFPRHLSQHVGGFVLTRDELDRTVPIENAAMDGRTVIEWDKDDIDAVGMLKIDVLGLGMLTALRRALLMSRGMSADASGAQDLLRTIPPEDPKVYDMVCAADTVGVFQIESRAQMSMLPRLRPRCFYDLVIEVAIVRPGPIQGDMVHPYLRRRRGEEPVSYPSAAVERVLGKTLGVPLFQEQAMRLAVVAAGFTPGEADQLRRAMAAWKKRGDAMVKFGEKLVRGMEERGYAAEFAQRVFRQLKGFSEYGFPESHAASFALLVYASCWLKRYHPAAFTAALINSQPMGFYAPAQLVRDAQAHGVTVRGVDVNASRWDCTMEACDPETRTRAEGADAPPSAWGASGPAVRLGLRLVHGLGKAAAEALVEARSREGPFADVASLWRACAGRVRRADLHALARADAFASMGLSRREAIWRVRALSDESLPLFDAAAHEDSPVPLPPARADEAVRLDYLSTGLSLKAHPISFIRERLKSRGAITSQTLRDERLTPAGARVMVGGIVLCRQKPGTASGVVFITLEDETGPANIIIRPRIYTRDRAAARHAVCLAIWGTVERQGEVVHVMATRVRELAAVASMEHTPPEMSRNFR